MLFGKRNLGDEKNKSKLFYLAVLSFIIVCIINIAMYKFLPNTLYLNSFGDKIAIKKELFLLILPLISIIGNWLNFKLNNRSSINMILFNIALPFISILANLYSK